MGKRLEYTPNSKIRQALRQLWLRSRERAKTIQRDKYTCQICHRKQSKAKGKEFKVQVHHLENILNWDKLFSAIREYLLCDPKFMQTLCEECHDEKTNRQGLGQKRKVST